MSKDTLTPITDILAAAAEDLGFQPEPDHRRVKAAFWAKFYEDPKMDRDRVTLAAVQQYLPDYRLRKWWSMPGFKEWFTNKDEWRQKQEYLVMLAQDEAERILLDRNANANAKVGLIKFLVESIGRASPKMKEVKMLDDAIHKMTPEQLEEFVKKGVLSLAGDK